MVPGCAAGRNCGMPRGGTPGAERSPGAWEHEHTAVRVGAPASQVRVSYSKTEMGTGVKGIGVRTGVFPLVVL